MPSIRRENVRHATLLFCAEGVNVRTTGAGKGERMFRVKGERRQDRDWHEKMIAKVAAVDVGAGIILAATYFEWCVRRSIVALGVSSVHELSLKLTDPNLRFDDLVELWNTEVAGRFGSGEMLTLPMLYDQSKGKPRFGNLPLTWQNIGRARKLRNALVHGDRCTPLDVHGRKYVDLLIAASARLAKTAEDNGHPIFNVIRRKAKSSKEIK